MVTDHPDKVSLSLDGACRPSAPQITRCGCHSNLQLPCFRPVTQPTAPRPGTSLAAATQNTVGHKSSPGAHARRGATGHTITRGVSAGESQGRRCRSEQASVRIAILPLPKPSRSFPDHSAKANTLHDRPGRLSCPLLLGHLLLHPPCSGASTQDSQDAHPRAFAPAVPLPATHSSEPCAQPHVLQV